MNPTLEKTQVRETGLKHLGNLTNLNWLNLAGTKVRDAGLQDLEGLTNLEYMDLKGTQVTRKGRKRLGQALPNCIVF